MSTETESKAVLIDNIEVCTRLGIKPGTWRKRVASGQAPLPHSVMGARTYYRLADVKYYETEGKWHSRMKFKGLQPQSPGDSPSN